MYAQLILRKGYHPNVDSYSAFIEADGAAARKEPEPATIRLRVPQGVGACTLIDGTRVDADADALVAVPPDHVNRLVLAGFTRL